MPRRSRYHRYRRIEWADAMASHETLVELAASATQARRPATAAVVSPQDSPANTRPLRIRASSSDLANADAHPATSAGAPVVRSESEQTASGAGSPEATSGAGEPKSHTGLLRRLKESLRRVRFPGIGVMGDPRFRDGRATGPHYYSVSLY
ncbi:hypothetical protein GGF46_002253 [Coemansia sp. RSA 552]|nr:hypothetical protein GGF46_002253 [Coemansia sp. RSA 552]